jgi:hypothetical protein
MRSSFHSLRGSFDPWLTGPFWDFPLFDLTPDFVQRVPARPNFIISIPTIWFPGLRAYRPTAVGNECQIIEESESKTPLRLSL